MKNSKGKGAAGLLILLAALVGFIYLAYLTISQNKIKLGLDLADGVAAAAALDARGIGRGDRDEHNRRDREDQREDDDGGTDAGVLHDMNLLLRTILV